MKSEPIPTVEELGTRLTSLDGSEILSFAARCAMQLNREFLRSPPHLPSEATTILLDYLNGPIAELSRFCQLLEQGDVLALSVPIVNLKTETLAAAKHFYDTMISLARGGRQPYDFDAWFDGHQDHGHEIQCVANCLASVADAALAFHKNDRQATARAAIATVEWAWHLRDVFWWKSRIQEFGQHLRRDLDLLCAASVYEKGGAVHSSQEVLITEISSGNEIVEVSAGFLRVINERITVDELLSLSPREFEALVADLWRRFGYTVELTKRTRDGGRDVIAVRREEVDMRILIECKRFRRSRKVGVDLVRTLYGVKADENATKAVLATTSTFSGEAMRFFRRHWWELEPRDHEGVVAWIKTACALSGNVRQKYVVPGSGEQLRRAP